MELRQLKFFARVAELKSISGAARDLNAAQPALSRHIRTLEAELGSSLFTRDGRGVALTSAGVRFYDHICGILQDLDDACAEVHDHKQVLAGEVRIGLLPTFGADFGAELSKLVKLNCPDVKLRLFEGQSNQVGNWLQNRTVDLGFVNDIHSFRNLSEYLEFKEDLFLVSARRSKDQRTCSLDVLKARKLISFAQPNHIRQNLEAAASRQNINLSFFHEIDSLESIVRLVSEEYGSAVLPLSAIWRDVIEYRLTASKIVQPEMSISLALAAPAKAKRTPVVTYLIRMIETLISDLIAQERWIGKLLIPSQVRRSDALANRTNNFREDLAGVPK